MVGTTVCRAHGGAAPQVKAAAARRLRDLQPDVIRIYDRALHQDDLGHALKAADSVAKLTAMGELDRALIEGLDPGRRALPNDVLERLIAVLERNAG